MLISCPNCAAGYEVPENLLQGAGRKLRCARCAQEFQAMLPPAPPPPELVELRDDPIVDPDPPAPRNDRRRLVLLAPIGGWALSLALLGMIGWSAIHWRTQIQATWPPSERLYAALGLS